MIATAPPPAVNRIATHLNAIQPPVPETPDGKREDWAETLFEAMRFLRTRLGHRDQDVAERAALAIFDLEKTRLRHGRDLAGTGQNAAPIPSMTQVEPTTEEVEDDAEAEDETDAIEQKDDEELVEEYVDHDLFKPLLAQARRQLEECGHDASDRFAVPLAKERLLESLKRVRATRGRT